MRYFFVFLLGALVGAAAMVPLVGARVESLELERQGLLLRLAEAQRSLAQLRSANRRWARPVVRSVELHFANVDEPALRLKLEERLKPLVQDLVGREIRGLDPFLIFGLFRDRAWRIGEKEYRPELRVAVVDEEMVLVLEVRERAAHGPAARRTDE